MRAEIISIGTELLMGYIVNTNASDIAKQLLDIGVGTYYQQTVGDNPTRLREAIALASSRSDLVIMTGGIGPTHDDITKQVMADYLGTTLVEAPRQLKKLEDFFTHEQRPLTDIDRLQVLTLAGGEALWNEYGLACGTYYQHDGVHYVILPGPPYEMNQMLAKEVLPRIKSLSQSDQAIESLYLNFYGIGEAKVAIQLADLIQQQQNPTIALYAKPRHVTMRLTANATTSEAAKQLNQQLKTHILEEMGQFYIGEGEAYDFETHIVQSLAKTGQTVATFESFTAGYVGMRLNERDPEQAVYVGSVVEREPKDHALIRQWFPVRLDEVQQQYETDWVVGAVNLHEADAKGGQAVLIGCYHRTKGYHEKIIYLTARPLSIQYAILLYETLNSLKLYSQTK